MPRWICAGRAATTDGKVGTSSCGSAIAAFSIAAEPIKGKPIGEAARPTNAAAAGALLCRPA